MKDSNYLMFKNFKKLKYWQQALFALLIGVSVVAFWRGTWRIMDLYLFPNNLALSYGVPLVAGLLVLYLTHYLTKELI